MAGEMGFEVLRFINRVRRSPTDATDPALLDKLEKLALDNWEGAHVALEAPMANQTWETKVEIAGADVQSGVASLDFTDPVEILAFYPTVVPKSLPVAGAAVAPTLDDMEVSITIDKKERFTQQQQPQTVNAQEEFVTASALTILAPRLVGIRVISPTPKLQFVWRWKQGAGVFVDCIACMAVIHRQIGASK